jgi:hypothetical protein
MNSHSPYTAFEARLRLVQCGFITESGVQNQSKRTRKHTTNSQCCNRVSLQIQMLAGQRHKTITQTFVQHPDNSQACSSLTLALAMSAF